MEKPFSMSVTDAAEHFGFAAATIYKYISDRKITEGREYLKVGRKVVIVREAFIEWMKEH